MFWSNSTSSAGVKRSRTSARIAAHRMVLFDLRAIVQRHFPAAEIDDFRSLHDMGVIERGLQTHHNLAAKELETCTDVPCPSVL